MPSKSLPQKGPQLHKATLKMLGEHSGLDFSVYKQSTIIRTIEERMTIARMTSEHVYLSFLKDHPEELALLSRDLLIGVTSFFRDKIAFKFLDSLVLAELFERDCSSDKALRFWIVGCSSGEEAYSLSILAQERVQASDHKPQLTIFATDIRPEAVARARLGDYPASISQHLSKARLERFFSPYKDGFKVKPSIRNPVVFAEHDIFRDIPFSRIDLVMCRNLLIYLKPSAQRATLEMIHFALKPNGYLFLGHSESVGNQGNLFRPLSHKWNVYQRVDDDGQSIKAMEAAYDRHRQLTLERAEIALEYEPTSEPSGHEEARFRNEELRSTNEELRNTNEELESSRDELHSTNLELKILYSAMEAKLEDATSMSHDFEKLFSSLNIAIILLDLDLRIVRYNQAATHITRLIPTDSGRAFADLDTKLEMAQTELLDLISNVLRELKSYQGVVRHQDGTRYAMTIKPTRSTNNQIKGILLTFATLG